MKLKYDELRTLFNLACLANQAELANKLQTMMLEEWNLGTVMPPMYQSLIVRDLRNNNTYTVRRENLLPSYSGDGEKGYTKVEFIDVHTGDTLELPASGFEWRRT